jgi:hypothetical protein
MTPNFMRKTLRCGGKVECSMAFETARNEWASNQ